MKTKRILGITLATAMLAGSMATLAACDNSKTLLIWGPGDHQDIYEQRVAEFIAQHEEFNGYKVQFAGSGDAGAYAAMNVDPATGAAVYTFANDQMANLVNLAALAPVREDNLKWSKENNSQAAYEATFIGDKSYAYPLQADNGYYMYYNKSAFRGTAVWDSEKDTLKDGYTFRNLYSALDQKTDNWKKGKVTWAMGDSWYVSGVFFSVGGDYEVKYDDAGKQTAADCWFSYTLPAGVTDWKDADFTVGMDAYQCLKNSITTTDGNVSSHYLYSDGDKNPLNDYIDMYTNADDPLCQDTPLAAAICGTWKAKQLQTAWGDDYAATVLPVLETDDGELFAMKNFAGYKHIGVNPQCEFAKQSKENLALLHQLAQYLSGKDVSIDRYNATGAGPANLEALKDPAIKSDAALLALNAQYDRVCVYPDNYSVEALRGTPIGNGIGYRNQDSVPANYWTPIQKFGNTLYNELSTKKLDQFKNNTTIKAYLAELQSEIAQAAQ